MAVRLAQSRPFCYFLHPGLADGRLRYIAGDGATREISLADVQRVSLDSVTRCEFTVSVSVAGKFPVRASDSLTPASRLHK